MVSIVVPVYNTGKCIKKCVDSLLRQSYPDIEILLVDDGSASETAALCDLCAEKDDKVSVYHCENRGVSAARNYGVTKAKGKYIFFADSDDYAESDMLEKMVALAEYHASALVVAGYYFDIPYRSKNGQTVECIEQKAPSFAINSDKELKEAMVYLWDASLMYNVWNKLFRLAVIKEHRILFPEGKGFNEDRDFVRNYLRHIQTVYVTEDCFYHYVRGGKGGATEVYRPDMLQIRKEELRHLRVFFTDLGIYDLRAREYVSREHFDRVVGAAENVFHSDLNARKIVSEIRKMVRDRDTKYALRYAAPKSRKMKMLHLLFKTRSAVLIYIVMQCIYFVKVKHPALFYRLRQSR